MADEAKPLMTTEQSAADKMSEKPAATAATGSAPAAAAAAAPPPPQQKLSESDDFTEDSADVSRTISPRCFGYVFGVGSKRKQMMTFYWFRIGTWVAQHQLLKLIRRLIESQVQWLCCVISSFIG